MNKYLLSFLLCCFLIFRATGQETEEVKQESQVGLNITGLLTQLPILPNEGQSAGVYALLYKQETRKHPGKYFRFSIGGKVGVGNFNNSAFSIGLGSERVWLSEGRWHLNYGYDFVLFLESSNVSTAVGIGYGPLVAIRFDISRRVSLLTEGSGFLTLTAGLNTGLAFTLRPPSGLVLVFRF